MVATPEDGIISYAATLLDGIEQSLSRLARNPKLPDIIDAAIAAVAAATATYGYLKGWSEVLQEGLAILAGAAAGRLTNRLIERASAKAAALLLAQQLQQSASTSTTTTTTRVILERPYTQGGAAAPHGFKILRRPTQAQQKQAAAPIL